MRLPWKRRRRHLELVASTPPPEAVEALKDAQADLEKTRDQYAPVLLRAERMRAWRSDAVNHFAESIQMAYQASNENPGGPET